VLFGEKVGAGDGARVISEETRIRLAQSIGSVERRRRLLATRVAERMSRMRSDELICGREAAAILIDLLIDGSSDIAAFGGLRDLSPAARKHHKLGLSGSDYSRFGLELPSALQSVLGLAVPPKTVNAWCDAFWLIVGHVQSYAPSAGPSARLH
jgi:hypothetical protein